MVRQLQNLGLLFVYTVFVFLHLFLQLSYALLQFLDLSLSLFVLCMCTLFLTIQIALSVAHLLYLRIQLKVLLFGLFLVCIQLIKPLFLHVYRLFQHHFQETEQFLNLFLRKLLLLTRLFALLVILKVDVDFDAAIISCLNTTLLLVLSYGSNLSHLLVYQG